MVVAVAVAEEMTTTVSVVANEAEVEAGVKVATKVLLVKFLTSVATQEKPSRVTGNFLD